MIISREQLKEYLKSDKEAMRIEHKKPKVFRDEIWRFEIWRFEIYLRKLEYYMNCSKSIIDKMVLE